MDPHCMWGYGYYGGYGGYFFSPPPQTSAQPIVTEVAIAAISSPLPVTTHSFLQYPDQRPTEVTAAVLIPPPLLGTPAYTFAPATHPVATQVAAGVLSPSFPAATTPYPFVPTDPLAAFFPSPLPVTTAYTLAPALDPRAAGPTMEAFASSPPLTSSAPPSYSERPRTFSCKVCSEPDFFSYREFRKHYHERHQGDRVTCCYKDCFTSYQSLPSITPHLLNEHAYIETDADPFKWTPFVCLRCPELGMMHSEAFRAHHIEFHPDKPTLCWHAECGASFPPDTDAICALMRHSLYAHTPYQLTDSTALHCTILGCSFSTLECEEWIEHMKAVHRDAFILRCPIGSCAKTYSGSSGSRFRDLHFHVEHRH